MQDVLDFLLHLDQYLAGFAEAYGLWVYGLLFLIIFAETGFVVTPFLPGDTLIFVAGALSGSGHLDWFATTSVIFVAAILGNTVNYEIGRAIGPRVFRSRWRWLNRKHLDEAHRFFLAHGGKTVVIARFLPIIRTFVPFVAGVGQMPRWQYFSYTVLGAFLWVAILFAAGYYFGNIAFVRNHLTLIVLAAVIVSLIPAVGMALRNYFKRKPEVSTND
ncbi:MAG: VTT domain-containing protein [Gammaproteobacteria bacterium]|nr:VTT domain-containing protein [Gammaproteobacteria bacterium]